MNRRLAAQPESLLAPAWAYWRVDNLLLEGRGIEAATAADDAIRCFPEARFKGRSWASRALTRKAIAYTAGGSAGAGIELQRMDPAVLDPAIDGVILGGHEPDDLLAQVGCPLHLLAAQTEFGGAMDAQDVQRFVSHAPRCTHTAFEGAGHGSHEERPAEYLHALQQFIAAAG